MDVVEPNGSGGKSQWVEKAFATSEQLRQFSKSLLAIKKQVPLQSIS
jgi:hypothetical protein